MALHSKLPIYKDAYQLMILTIQLTRNIPREVKLIVGGKLRDLCLEVVMMIYRANRATNKLTFIEKLLDHLVAAEVMFRMSRDMKFISTGQYAQAITLTQSVGRQANGWRKKYAPSPVT